MGLKRDALGFVRSNRFGRIRREELEQALEIGEQDSLYRCGVDNGVRTAEVVTHTEVTLKPGDTFSAGPRVVKGSDDGLTSGGRGLKGVARETAASIKTLNREIRELQAEYAVAPNYSFTKRLKIQIAEEIVRLEQRKANYVRKLNALNVQQRQRQAPGPSPNPARQRFSRADSPSGWDKVRMQSRIDDLHRQIGVLGERIRTMNYTPERKRLIQQHKELIRQRRQLIWEINQR